MAAPMKLQEELFRIAQNEDFSVFEGFIQTHFQSNRSWLELYHKKSGDTVLSFAARGGNRDIVEYLARHGQDLEQANFDGKRALHETAQFGKLACMQYLLQQGVVVDALKRADWTPLMLACTKTDLSVIRCLLDAGANPALVNKDGWNSFHLACREGDEEVVRYLLSMNGRLWEAVSNNGRTPLHTAALHGHGAVVELLLGIGGGGGGGGGGSYHVDVKDGCGVTPLMDAVRADFVKVAEVLLAAGADVCARDHMGRHCVHVAAQAGATHALQFLLQHEEAHSHINAHSTVTRATPLHLAAKEGQGEAVRALLAAGADAQATDSRTRTALDLAIGCRHTSCVAILQHASSPRTPSTGHPLKQHPQQAGDAKLGAGE